MTAQPYDLARLQREFPLALSKLIQHVYDLGYACTMAEGYVGDTDSRDLDHDGPHRHDGGHYKRIAQDINVFAREPENGEWVWQKRGTERCWPLLGRYWQALHPQARWSPLDPNHFALIHRGVA